MSSAVSFISSEIFLEIFLLIIETGIVESRAVVLHVLLEDLYLTYYIPVVDVS